MIRKKSDLNFFMEKFLDQVIVYISWLSAYFVRFEQLPDAQQGLFDWYLKYGLILVVISTIFFKNGKIYQSEHIFSFVKQIILLIRANIFSILIFVVLAFFLSQDRVSRIVLVSYFIISSLLLILNKVFFRKIILSKDTSIVVFGNGRAINDYLEKISRMNKFKVIARDPNEIPVNTDLIVIGYDNKDFFKVDEILKKYSDSLVPLVVLPDIQESTLGYEIQSFFGIPMIVFNEPNFKSLSLFIKRIMDIFLCSVGLIFISPLLLLIALLVKLSSRGPIFYGQVRMGLDGKEFKMWKFRSMVTDSTNKETWTVKNDPRVTKIGSFIRKTSIDELPQLWNVITGDMSLVGPRPERPQYVNQFRKEIPAYMLRHKMRAGITGWAQVNGWRGDTSIEKRIECDLWYIKNWSLWLDIEIIFLTFWKGFINKNAY